MGGRRLSHGGGDVQPVGVDLQTVVLAEMEHALAADELSTRALPAGSTVTAAVSSAGRAAARSCRAVAARAKRWRRFPGRSSVAPSRGPRCSAAKLFDGVGGQPRWPPELPLGDRDAFDLLDRHRIRPFGRRASSSSATRCPAIWFPAGSATVRACSCARGGRVRDRLDARGVLVWREASGGAARARRPLGRRGRP